MSVRLDVVDIAYNEPGPRDGRVVLPDDTTWPEVASRLASAAIGRSRHTCADAEQRGSCLTTRFATVVRRHRCRRSTDRRRLSDGLLDLGASGASGRWSLTWHRQQYTTRHHARVTADRAGATRRGRGRSRRPTFRTCDQRDHRIDSGCQQRREHRPLRRPRPRSSGRNA